MHRRETILRKKRAVTELDLPISKGPPPTTRSMRESIIPKTMIESLDIENLSIPLPKGKSLLKFQDPAIRRMLTFLRDNKMKGVYNGYDPGLGKTLMAIATFANVLKAKKILVICPPVMRGKWEEEIKTWDVEPNPTVHALYTARGALRPITAKWCVVSYHLLLKENVFRLLDSYDWDAVICDEAKELKSIRAKRTKLVLALWQNARRGIWMDGTPVTNSVEDFYTSCHAMMPEHYTDYTEFCERYCLKKSVPWGQQGWVYCSGQNMEELSNHIRSNFFIRKTKEEVLPDLPDTTYQKVVLDCGSFNTQLTEEQERRILTAVREGKDPNANARPEEKKSFAERRLEAGLKTLEAGKDLIGGLLEGGTPLMVIAYHRAVIDAIMQIFQQYNPVKIDGSVVGVNKEKAYKAFNAGQTNLIVLQIKSAVGIDLQSRCSEAIYVELSFDPTQIRQSLDRLRRIGQKSAVRAQFFVAKGSIDEDVLEILKEKLKIIDQVVQSSDE